MGMGHPLTSSQFPSNGEFRVLTRNRRMHLRFISSPKPPLNPITLAASHSFFSTFSHQGQTDLPNHLNISFENHDNIDQTPTNQSYWTKHIHKLCTVDRDVDSAFHLLSHICLRGYRLNALNVSSIIHAFCDANRYAQAHHQLLLFITSQPDLLDERTCNVLIARLLHAATPHATLVVIHHLINANPNFVPSLMNYNRLIHQVCRLLKPSEAHQLFWDMRKRGHFPSVVSYTSLIGGYCKIGDIDVANKLFDEMREAGVLPNTMTYSVLIEGVFRKRDVERGNMLMGKLWEVMGNEEDKLVNNAAFGNVINSLCKEGLFHEVFKIAEDMPQAKGVLEEFAYSQMIESLCKYGRFNGAARIVYMMQKRGFTPGFLSYNSILHGLCLEGDCFRAYQLLEEGINFGYGPSEFTYKHLVEGLCRECDLVKAKEVLNIMLSNKEGKQKTRIFNIYLRAVCAMHNPTELLNGLVSMLQEQCQPDVITLNTVVNGLCKTGRVAEASKVLKDMMAGKFCAPDVITFTTIISGLLEVGNVQEALHLFRSEMPGNGVRPVVLTYNALIRGLFNLGRVDEAMEIFNSMVAGGAVADCTTYTVIIQGFFNSERTEDAKRFWDEIVWPSKVHDNYVYSAILRGLCDSGKFDEACDFLYELVDCGAVLNHVNYNILIDYACKLGLKKGAYQILGEMRKNGVAPDPVTWRLLDKLHSNGRNQYGEDSTTDYRDHVPEFNS
ncbi:pentatricopeptide repeat-containing protein At3g18020 [Coffea eugenioides]|uniref:pentatricopeptide repeat-containing protein At3g18020 n=1 Tax=Coffea eugenioides TaxID=49369 RepID=UPI000F6109E1|nr:pentatricopeptide repeat-containing protein At3g18020 [Coffea eugenioides]